MDGDKVKLTKACQKNSEDPGNANGPCFKEIGGVTGKLPERNTQSSECAENLPSCQIHGEINPFSQVAEWLKDAEEEAASWPEIDDRREADTRNRREAR